MADPFWRRPWNPTHLWIQRLFTPGNIFLLISRDGVRSAFRMDRDDKQVEVLRTGVQTRHGHLFQARKVSREMTAPLVPAPAPVSGAKLEPSTDDPCNNGETVRSFCPQSPNHDQVAAAESQSGDCDPLSTVPVTSLMLPRADSLQNAEGQTAMVRQKPGRKRPAHTQVWTCPELVCQKEFRYRSTFEEHYRSHSGERPYECLHCGNSFTTKNRLRVHQRIHNDEKPYSCAFSGCNFAARQASDVTQHHKSIHERVSRRTGVVRSPSNTKTTDAPPLITNATPGPVIVHALPQYPHYWPPPYYGHGAHANGYAPWPHPAVMYPPPLHPHTQGASHMDSASAWGQTSQYYAPYEVNVDAPTPQTQAPQYSSPHLSRNNAYTYVPPAQSPQYYYEAPASGQPPMPYPSPHASGVSLEQVPASMRTPNSLKSRNAGVSLCQPPWEHSTSNAAQESAGVKQVGQETAVTAHVSHTKHESASDHSGNPRSSRPPVECKTRPYDQQTPSLPSGEVSKSSQALHPIGYDSFRPAPPLAGYGYPAPPMYAGAPGYTLKHPGWGSPAAYV